MILRDDDVLAKFRAAWRCEWCLKPTPSGCDPAHVFSRAAGRVDAAFNLWAACRSCHQNAHTGQICREAILAMVAKREGITVAEIRSRVNAVRRYDRKAAIARGLHEAEMLKEALSTRKDMGCQAELLAIIEAGDR